MTKDKHLSLSANSVFGDVMKCYVDQKRSLGYVYDSVVEALNGFDKFCLEQNVTECRISRELLASWETKRPSENATNQLLRISAVRGLCEYMAANDYEVPTEFHKAPTAEDYVPHIFSEEELHRFFTAVDAGATCISSSPVRHLVLPELFRLLYTCGLRVSEAVHLKTVDVDLENGIIMVYGAKGNKDRMVGLSNSMLNRLRKYRSNSDLNVVKSEYFFPCSNGGYYSTSTIYDYFRKFLAKAGIPHEGRGKGPRLHDLRHTYAVHALMKWSKEGKDLYVCLPRLQYYLGHANLKATEHYMRLIPEAYHEMTEPFDNQFASVVKEVENATKV